MGYWNANIMAESLGCLQLALHSRHCPLAMRPPYWFIFLSILWWCDLRKQWKMKITATLKATPASHSSCCAQHPWPIFRARLSSADLIPSPFAPNFQICILSLNSFPHLGVYFCHIRLFYCCFVYFVRMAASILAFVFTFVFSSLVFS